MKLKGLLLTTIAGVTVSLAIAIELFPQYFEFPPMPPKDEYGNVVMDNYSSKKGMAPVIFRHWTHRRFYTCRVCHIELYFMMVANQTGVRERDNRKGRFCGACHNGKDAFAPEEDGNKNCDRCHQSPDSPYKPDINKVLAGLPKYRFGNGVDWVKAVKEGKIHLKDSIFEDKVKRVKFEKELVLEAEMRMIPPARFTHKSHLLWLDCENCHPDIFDIKKKGTHFSMDENLKGRFCGSCHGKVSFPLQDCWRCHIKKKRRHRRR